MHTPLQIVVTGASGRQGTQVIRHLLTNQHDLAISIRAVVTDSSSSRARKVLSLAEGYPRNRSIALYQASYADREGLARACAGAHALFLLVRPTWHDPEQEIRNAQALLDAAHESGTLRHIVYTSVVGTDDPYIWKRLGGLMPWATHANIESNNVAPSIPKVDYDALEPFAFGEGHAASSAVKEGSRRYFSSKIEIEGCTRAWADEKPDQRTWTIVRPAFFMSNPIDELDVFFPELEGPERAFRTATRTEKALMLVAPEDVGQVSALALVGPAQDPNHKLAGRAIQVGSEALRVDQMAQAFSKAIGQKIAYEFVDEPTALRDLAAGRVNREGQGWIIERENCFEVKELEMALGIQTMSFDAYLAKHIEKVRERFKT